MANSGLVFTGIANNMDLPERFLAKIASVVFAIIWISNRIRIVFRRQKVYDVFRGLWRWEVKLLKLICSLLSI
jgi:hypothetical protein